MKSRARDGCSLLMPFPRRCLPPIAAAATARTVMVFILRYLGNCIWGTRVKGWGALVEGRCLEEGEGEKEGQEEEVIGGTPGMRMQGMLLLWARRALIGTTR